MYDDDDEVNSKIAKSESEGNDDSDMSDDSGIIKRR
jgi:hypothetical protein